MRYIDIVANGIYSTPSGTEGAREYLRSRGIIKETAFPFIRTSADSNLYKAMMEQCGEYPQNGKLNATSFSDVLAMPVASIRNPRWLAGFSLRYLGDNKTNRLRYITIKEDPSEVFVYYTNVASLCINQPVFITESIIDAESITQATGFMAVSFLSAYYSMQTAVWLTALSSHLVFAYDNDNAGNAAFNKYEKFYNQIRYGDSGGRYNILSNLRLHRLSFPCKDINEFLCNYGNDYAGNYIKTQLNI